MMPINVPIMNRAIAEDVNVPALRNPLNHLAGKPVRRPRRAVREAGWIDARFARCRDEHR